MVKSGFLSIFTLILLIILYQPNANSARHHGFGAPHSNPGFNTMGSGHPEHVEHSHRNQVFFIYTPYYSYPYPETYIYYSPSEVTYTPSDNYLNPVGDYSNATWVTASDGYVPDNAVPYANKNGFYCRTAFNQQMIYGVLIRNDGCYINDNEGNEFRTTQYEVLVY